MTWNRTRIVLTAGVLCALFSALLVSGGLKTNIDGQAYWEGSVSLLRGQGYVMLDGTPILEWPPLYSVYLAGWQALFGVSGQTLILSTIALSAIAGMAWALLLLAATKRTEHSVNSATILPPWLLLLLVVAAIPVSMRALHAMNLLFTLLPLHFCFLLAALNKNSLKSTSTIVGLFVTAALLPLTHNSGAIFIAASCVLVLVHVHEIPRKPGIIYAVATASAITPWFITQRLGQHSSHPISWGAGREDFVTYLWQLITGMAQFSCLPTLPCVPTVALLLLTLFVLYLPAVRRRLDLFEGITLPRPLLVLLGHAAIVTPLLLIVFNLVWIHDPLSGRFIFAQMLLITAAGLTISAGLRNRLAAKGLGIVIVLPLLLHLAGLIAVYQGGWQAAVPRKDPHHFITPAQGLP